MTQLAKTIARILTGVNDNELVWVDDGRGDIVAITGSEHGRCQFLRQPRQVKKSEVDLGMKVLDSKTLREYNEAIAIVMKKRSKNVAKAADTSTEKVL